MPLQSRDLNNLTDTTFYKTKVYKKKDGTWYPLKNMYKKVNGIWKPLYKYSWSYSAWSPSDCGPCDLERVTRTATCKRSDGLTMEDKYCTGITKEALSKNCNWVHCEEVLTGLTIGVDDSVTIHQTDNNFTIKKSNLLVNITGTQDNGFTLYNNSFTYYPKYVIDGYLYFIAEVTNGPVEKENPTAFGMQYGNNYAELMRNQSQFGTLGQRPSYAVQWSSWGGWYWAKNRDSVQSTYNMYLRIKIE